MSDTDLATWLAQYEEQMAADPQARRRRLRAAARDIRLAVGVLALMLVAALPLALAACALSQWQPAQVAIMGAAVGALAACAKAALLTDFTWREVLWACSRQGRTP